MLIGASEKPEAVALVGNYVRMAPLDWNVQGQLLEHALVGDKNASLWEYVAAGPYATRTDMEQDFGNVIMKSGWAAFFIQSLYSETACGLACFMRIRPEHKSLEIGSVMLGRELQNSVAATEAFYLFAKHVFEDLGFRRYEWKCDARNKDSRSAAERLGFIYEGVFRQDMIMKGRNRDTAWFSILDHEWPQLKLGYEKWLQPENFDKSLQQRRSLRQCRE